MASSASSYFNLTDEEEYEAFMSAFIAVGGLTLPMAFKSAIELGIPDLIAKAGPGARLSASDLAAQLPKQSPLTASMLDRLLRFLACFSFLNCALRTLPDGHSERIYGLAPVCKYFVDAGDGISLTPLLTMAQDKIRLQIWENVSDAILEGEIPFNMTHGMSAFEFHAKDPRFSKIFNLGMSSHSTIIMNKILETYKGFEAIESLVDVGGGIGTSLHRIISKYPSIKGINFDLPHVIKDAPSISGVEHVGGDMFVNVPKGDAIFMKWILHDWNDESCIKILKNCYASLPDNGKVIVVESILPKVPNSSLDSKSAVVLDISMMCKTPRGKERTEEDFRALAKGSGFSDFRKVCPAFNVWITEFCK